MVQAFITLVPVKDQFQKPTVLIAEISGFGIQVLVGFEDNDAEDVLLLSIALL
jgi:hypothetical protein